MKDETIIAANRQLLNYRHNPETKPANGCGQRSPIASSTQTIAHQSAAPKG